MCITKKSGRWTWIFRDADTLDELGSSPEQLLNSAPVVKANPVRRVFDTGKFFVKLDRRTGKRGLAEWRSAALAAENGLPTVEYLACGESLSGSCVITRKLADSETVTERFYQDYVRGGENPENFINNFSAFVKKVLESGLFHPDFHIGNILCSGDRFVLVDLYGIRRATLIDRMFKMYRMRRIGMELREVLSQERILKLLGDCGIDDPEDFYDDALDREADALWDEWPKRRRQILAGYPKFARNIDGVLHVVNPLRQIEELVDYQPVDGDPRELEKLFLAYYFLRMANIPHRRVGGFDRVNGKLYIEPVPAGALPTQPGELAERLEALDIASDMTDWLRTSDHDRIRFFNLKKIANALEKQ